MAKVIEWNRQMILLNALNHRHAQVEEEIATLRKIRYSKSYEIMNLTSERYEISKAIAELLSEKEGALS